MLLAQTRLHTSFVIGPQPGMHSLQTAESPDLTPVDVAVPVPHSMPTPFDLAVPGPPQHAHTNIVYDDAGSDLNLQVHRHGLPAEGPHGIRPR